MKKESILNGFKIIESTKDFKNEEEKQKEYNNLIVKLEEVLYNN